MTSTWNINTHKIYKEYFISYQWSWFNDFLIWWTWVYFTLFCPSHLSWQLKIGFMYRSTCSIQPSTIHCVAFIFFLIIWFFCKNVNCFCRTRCKSLAGTWDTEKKWRFIRQINRILCFIFIFVKYKKGNYICFQTLGALFFGYLFVQGKSIQIVTLK